MINMELKFDELLTSIKKLAPFKPEIGIILGSGLGDFANEFNLLKSVSTNDLRNYPKSTVKGHKGMIHFCEYQNKKLILFQGRIHFYEGYNISECILPVHIIYNLGCEKLLLTNAAGGLNPTFKPGDLMLISDFLSFNIKNEISSVLPIPTLETKNSFLDFPSESISKIIKDASLEENIFLKEGNYWFGKGPSYETPAEIKMLLKFGIDAVGMSTVHEAIYARNLGMEVAGISLITNYAAGLSPTKLSHQEVIETAEQAKEKFQRLIKRIIALQ